MFALHERPLTYHSMKTKFLTSCLVATLDRFYCIQYTVSCLFKDVIAVGKMFSIQPSMCIVHKNIQNFTFFLHRGSYMSSPVLLNLLNELRKRDKM